MPLRRLLATLRADLFGVSDRGRMVRSAGATAALKVGSTALAFGASLLYARTLGPHGYGLFAYVMAWATLLAIPVGLGLPTYLIREGAKTAASPHSLRRWADARVLASGALAAVLMACAVFIPQANGARWLFVVAAPIPLLSSLGSVRQALMQAHGAVARSQWPNWILAPALTIAALLVIWAWRGTLQPLDLMLATVGAAVCALIINQLQLRRVNASSDPRDAAPHAMRVRAALPFMWLGGLYLLVNRTDLIMLGALKGAHDAGIYAVASRAAALVSFFAAAVNTTLAPRIASLHQAGNHISLQRLVRAAARRFLILTLPLTFLLIAAAPPLLDNLYGASYVSGATAMRILAAGQFLVLAFGSVSTILNMTGHERQSVLAVAVAAPVNIALNLILISFYGVTGAAVATALSLTLAQALMWYQVRKRLNLTPSGFGF